MSATSFLIIREIFEISVLPVTIISAVLYYISCFSCALVSTSSVHQSISVAWLE